MIEQYWAENKKKAPPKKATSESASAKRTSTAPRKSITADADASDAERGGSASAPPKKRGRKSNSAVKTAENGGDDDADARPAKKPRKTAGDKDKEKEKEGKEKGKKLKSVEPLPEEDEIGDMSKHMHVPAWDHLIRHIDTVERVDDTLYVYFTLYVFCRLARWAWCLLLVLFSRNSGERIKEDSKKCSDKFPRKVRFFFIGASFYRSRFFFALPFAFRFPPSPVPPFSSSFSFSVLCMTSANRPLPPANRILRIQPALERGRPLDGPFVVQDCYYLFVPFLLVSFQFFFPSFLATSASVYAVLMLCL